MKSVVGHPEDEEGGICFSKAWGEEQFLFVCSAHLFLHFLQSSERKPNREQPLPEWAVRAKYVFEFCIREQAFPSKQTVSLFAGDTF